MSVATLKPFEESFPPSLKNVAPFQVTFLMWIGVLALDFASTKATMSSTLGTLESPVRQLLFHGGQFLIVGLFIAVLPTFRAALPVLFARRAPLFELDVLVLALFLAVSWAVGLHAMLVLYPSILASPELAAGFWRYSTVPIAPAYPEFALTLLATCVLAPIVEEVLNRGLLLGALRERYSLARAIAIGAVIFGAFHYRNFAIVAPIGVIYAVVAIRYQSLWPSILLHISYNTIVAMPWFVNVFLAKDPSTATRLSNWIPELVLAILTVPLTFLFIRRLRRPVE
jgi:membrane protease YdiL (CAAX protease family)